MFEAEMFTTPDVEFKRPCPVCDSSVGSLEGMQR